MVLALALSALGACAAPAPPAEPFDPSEAQNRKTHAFNKSLDKALFGPASEGYGTAIPEPVQRGVQNFAGNLDLPGDVLNGILQGRPGRAAENTVRFVLNTTIGVGGLFDPARAIGVEGKPTDFGETLHVWGVAEGAYQELPGLGPSTDRDTVGRVVDIFINPVRLAVPDEGRLALTGLGAVSTLGDRYRFGDTVDSILYESADSYAQTRLLYLQNRRFELGQTTAETDFEDPYAE
jgi:phospholipid-binding lipoprotein MlaA